MTSAILLPKNAAPTNESYGQTPIPIDEHLLEIGDVCERFGTTIQPTLVGLTTGQVEEYRMLSNNASNELSPPKRPSHVKHFLSCLMTIFNILLMVSGALSLLIFFVISSEPKDYENLYLGVILFIVSFANAAMAFIQEYRTASLLDSFKKMIPQSTTVIRDGSIERIEASQLIPGDLIMMKGGDKVPADVRLIECDHTLRVDNSSLTGESEPQERSIAQAEPETSPQEASNLVFNGTVVVCGEGKGIVIRIGDHTLLGQIAMLTMGGAEAESQLTREIDVFVKGLAVVAISIAALFFIVGLMRSISIGLTFSFAVGVFISFVPEGLPLTVTALLTLAAKRMAERQVLVKDLHGVETLGAITLLATDKTGTLTQNRMSVSDIWMNGQLHEDVEKLEVSPDGSFSRLLEICALCTKAKVTGNDGEVLGDATEVGLLKFALHHRTNMEALEAQHPRVWEVPFSSQTKWHLTVHGSKPTAGSDSDLDKRPAASTHLVLLKGAPERVAAKCRNIAMNDGSLVIPWNDVVEADFQAAYAKLAGKGRRVLGFASATLPIQANLDTLDSDFIPFTFNGLIALMDPPKPGVARAISALRMAGVRVVMVTGDHPLTAEAIARRIGIIQESCLFIDGKVHGSENGDNNALHSDEGKFGVKASNPDDPFSGGEEKLEEAVVVHGDAIDSLSEAAWDYILSRTEVVFARTTPRHKLEIVTRCQAKGHIVGVSGDGVNDAPALKKADLGISMNRTASDVSKDAAAMILLDDDFCSIIIGIEEGRLLFANLKKSLRYTLTHSLPEIVAFLAFVLLGIPLPINTLLLLCIDLLTEMAPSISLAWEPAEANLMLVPPRKVLCTAEYSYAQIEAMAGSTRLAEQSAAVRRLASPHPLTIGAPLKGALRRYNTISGPLSSDYLRVEQTFSKDSRTFGPQSQRGLGLLAASRSETAWSAAPFEAPGAELLPTALQPCPEKTGARLRRIWNKLWRPLRQCLQRNFVRLETGEVLVDGDLILWAYMEAGVIIAIGCFGAYLWQLSLSGIPLGAIIGSSGTYFQENSGRLPGTALDGSAQLDALHAAQSAYFLAIVIGQLFTLIVVKKYWEYPLGKDVFRNPYSLAAMAISVGIASGIIFMPFLHSIIPAAVLAWQALLPPVFAGIFLVLYEYVRRALRLRGYFGGIPEASTDHLQLVRTATASIFH